MNTKQIIKKLKKDAYAVSPVIATLMLVLVSVGAAGIFYVWQSGWQDATTDSVEDTEIKGTLILGGSSTVYPVSVDAAEAFMLEYPQYKVQVKAGGSDTGIMGAGEGILDIGAASKDVSEEYFAKYPSLVQITIGYDGVVPIVNDGNPHGLISIDRATLGAIYHLNGELDADQYIIDKANELDGIRGVPANGYITWDEVPKYVDQTTEFCTGPATPVIVTERSVASGTEECFGEKLMDKDFAGQKEFTLSGTYTYGATNNQGILDYMQNTETQDVLGFMAYGLAGGSPSLAGNDACDIVAFKEHGGVAKTFDETGATSSDSLDPGLPTYVEIGTGVWSGSRTLNYITDGMPTGLAMKFIDFVLWTENNQDFLNSNGYVDLYDVTSGGSAIIKTGESAGVSNE